jgi:hypothetical protein
MFAESLSSTIYCGVGQRGMYPDGNPDSPSGHDETTQLPIPGNADPCAPVRSCRFSVDAVVFIGSSGPTYPDSAQEHQHKDRSGHS